MLEKIIVKEATNLSSILMCKEVDLYSKVNLLFGGNGAGKTTLIKALLGERFKGEFKSIKDNRQMMVYKYINSEQNARELERNSMFSYKDMFDPFYIARMYNAKELSEGQSIVYTFRELLDCAKIVKDDVDNLFIIDEVDSGLSVDNIEWLCKEIDKIVKSKDNIQFIISFNNYAFCEYFKEVTSMYTGKKQVIESYEQFKDEVCKWSSTLRKNGRNHPFK